MNDSSSTSANEKSTSSLHEQHLRKMVEFYEKTGDQYNSWHCDPDNTSSHNFAVSEILQTMKHLDAKSLLDVCCGTGRAVRSAMNEGYTATGIDVSPSLVEIGRREFSIPDDRLLLGDATHLPFGDNSFDVSCILGALHHTAEPHLIIREMIRVTRQAIIVSDEANHLTGGIKHILLAAGIFKPVYRLIFRREPRTERRQHISESDGPTFNFSIEEIIPELRHSFKDFRCLTFYRFGSFQFANYHLPRLFAKQGVITVMNKNEAP